MHPTTFRGEAIINGERVSSVLEVDDSSIRLSLASGQEVVDWMVDSARVDTFPEGVVEFHHDGERFTFVPGPEEDLTPAIETLRPSERTRAETAELPVARRVTDQKLSRRRAHVSTGRSQSPLVDAIVKGQDIGPRYAFAILGTLAALVVGVALLSNALTNQPADTVAAPETLASTASTSVQPDDSSVATQGPSSTAEADTEVAPTTTEPEVAGVTVTTEPIPSQDPAVTIFELEPTLLDERWDDLARSLSPNLAAQGINTEPDAVSFQAGDYMRVSATSGDDGLVERTSLEGDPSGPAEKDREVLSGLGILIALTEPELPPEGRRQLLEALGLDIADPDLAGLDGELEYEHKMYLLRWDSETERVVLEVEEVDTAE